MVRSPKKKFFAENSCILTPDCQEFILLQIVTAIEPLKKRIKMNKNEYSSLGFRDFSDHSILIFSVVSGRIAEKNVFCRELMYLDSRLSGIFSAPNSGGDRASQKK